MKNPLNVRLGLTSLLFVLFLTACGSATPTPSPTVVVGEPAVATLPSGYPAEESAQAVAQPTVENKPEGYPAGADVAVVQPTAESKPEGYPAVVDEPAGTPRIFAIDPTQTTVSYVVEETFLENSADSLGIPAGLVDTIGSTQEVSGQLVLDLSQAQFLLSSEFEVDLSTLTSDQERRDNRLKDEWLESATYPLATFKSTSVSQMPQNYVEGFGVELTVEGELTIRGVTKPAVFEVNAKLENGVITGTAVADLLMSDFGVEPPTMLGLFSVEDAFQVQVEFVATEQK